MRSARSSQKNIILEKVCNKFWFYFIQTLTPTNTHIVIQHWKSSTSMCSSTDSIRTFWIHHLDKYHLDQWFFKTDLSPWRRRTHKNTRSQTCVDALDRTGKPPTCRNDLWSISGWRLGVSEFPFLWVPFPRHENSLSHSTDSWVLETGTELSHPLWCAVVTPTPLRYQYCFQKVYYGWF